MKTLKAALTVLPLIAAFFMAGCADMLMERPEASGLAKGEGLLVVSLAGVNVGTSSRTMLPADPQFTRYELDVGGITYPFYNSTFQIPLVDGTYSITAKGYEGDKLVATSGLPQSVSISAGNITPATFTLKPYMGVDAESNPIPGVLNFSLNWDGLSRMPYRAELLVERYADAAGTLANPPTPISSDIIPTEFASGSSPGLIRLLDRDSARVNLTGALTLPPGEYRLTMSVTMDKDTAPASRLDLAHIYSNLSTPAPFYYGGGDIYISNTSPDSGASFITGFTFTETPNAATVIGSEPGLDGTRMIMIMAPAGTDLTQLTPIVTCAEGAVITSPLPATQPTQSTPKPGYDQGEIDFSNPTIWTAQAKNGAVQKYTVVVSKTAGAPEEKLITYFFFKEYPACPAVIDQVSGTITVVVPFGTKAGSAPYYNFIPVISFVGTKVVFDDDIDPSNGETELNCDGTDAAADYEISSTPILRVYASDNTRKNYAVFVLEAANTEAEITHFAIDGYPDRVASIATTPDGNGDYPITLTLPYGVSLKDRTPLIQYKGKTLNPASGIRQNFSGPIYYTVTAQDNSTKTYQVTITNDAPDKNTGIFDFRVTNVPNAKVVIGQKPRQDGKIPIVIQVPFGTDETNMIAAITLSSSAAHIHPFVNGSPSTTAPANGAVIPFGNAGNAKEAVYRVTAEDGVTTQDYVALVSAGGQYYYVDGKNGRDDLPDYYNGETEGRAFKTLAHAVEAAASNPSINKVFLLGDLTADDGGNNTSGSAFAINGSGGKTITIASVTGATLHGKSGERVVSVSGGADLVFENISITGGNTTGNGGGLYISENSKVKFSGGSITGNTAASGGGVYVEGNTATGSEFTFMGGEISGNTATSAAAGNTDATLSGMGGGGGVYVKGGALFWLAGGTIANNTAKGAGGGVLVNGNVTGAEPTLTESGFLMSGGKIAGNKSASTTYPHGGGGVYVAKGAFEMLNGEITGNTATRQGGGVFVHWGQARFTASGNSTITGNEGVGSSKAICNRGTTEMNDNARADKVYIWNYDGANPEQSFALTPNVQVDGIVLAYSAANKNFITLSDDPWTGTNTICTIDLESHLNNSGSLAGQLEPDWLHKNIIRGDFSLLNDPDFLKRLPLNSFTGQPSVYNLKDHYRIAVSGGNPGLSVYGTFEKK
jgi:hypothetical protein